MIPQAPQRPPTSAVAWRCFVVLLAAVAVVQFGIELAHAPRVLTQGVYGQRLFSGSFLREPGPTRFVVETLPPDSPLVAAGVEPGDYLRYEEPMQPWNNLAAGDTVTVFITHDGTERALTVTVPAAAQLPRFQVSTYIISIASGLLGLLVGVILGWWRANRVALRAVAATALLTAIAYPYSAPTSAHLPLLDFVASVANSLGLSVIVFFAINYPDDQPEGWRAVMKRWYPWFFTLMVGVTLVYYAGLYNGVYFTWCRWLFRVADLVQTALFFLAILLAWRQARGELRVRFQWIVATLGAIVAQNLVGNFNVWAGDPIPGPEMALVLNVVILAAELGFVYAVFRHRVVDFGLAVNRTLVYTIAGGVVLGAFQVVHGVLGEFLRFDDKYKAILLSGILSAAVYLSFNRLKKVIEQVVERLFFSSWAEREDELKRFVDEAGHATSAQSLATACVAALDRFTQGAGCALYQRRPDEGYQRTQATLANAPEELDANDKAVLAMRARDRALRLRESPLAAVAALAVPVSHRGQLLGFALIGAKSNGDAYRADEIEALESCAQRVGLDVHALRMTELEAAIAAERRATEILRAQLLTAMQMGGRAT